MRRFRLLFHLLRGTLYPIRVQRYKKRRNLKNDIKKKIAVQQ